MNLIEHYNSVMAERGKRRPIRAFYETLTGLAFIGLVVLLFCAACLFLIGPLALAHAYENAWLLCLYLPHILYLAFQAGKVTR